MEAKVHEEALTEKALEEIRMFRSKAAIVAAEGRGPVASEELLQAWKQSMEVERRASFRSSRWKRRKSGFSS